MIRRLVLAILAVVALPLLARADADPSVLARLAAAAAQYPDDPDLALAWGNALAAAGQASEAADALARVEARWHGRRPELPLRIVQLLYAAGRDGDALAAVESLLAADPGSGPAHLYRGLLLRRAGRGAEAEPELQRAAELAPELRAESLLLRGLALMERGQDREAEPLLQEAIQIDPSSETARRSRLLLPQRSRVVDGPLATLGTYGGYEYDSNVTLASGLDLGGLSSKRDDSGGVFGGSLVLRPLRGETTGLVLGYRFDTSLHRDLGFYDFQNHLGFASAYLRAGERTTLRLDGVMTRGLLDEQRYFGSFTVRPNVFVSFGDELGVSRLYVDYEDRHYSEDPFLSSLKRSGNVWGAGLDHTFVLPFAPSVQTTLRGRYATLRTSARTDLFGFEGAYDNDRYEAGVGFRFPLLWKIVADAGVGIGYEPFRHRNVIDFLTDDGVGNFSPRHRRDFGVDGSISLSRPIFRGVSLELAWRGSNHASNVDLYDYPRHVIGMYVRFQTD